MYLYERQGQEDRAMAQAFRLCFLIAVARVRSEVSQYGNCGLSETGVGFLPDRRFFLPILISPTVPYSLIILSSTSVVSILTALLNNQLFIVPGSL
jgi:hypothetical protein